MSAPETKDRILDAAERLFAGHGFEATSLRALTREAEVNLAAVHYHFGSKDNLFQAVFARRVEPINRDRLTRLDALERAGDPALEDILEAFLRPPLELSREPGGEAFMRIAGRIFSEPGDQWLPIIAQFDEVRARFVPALQRALPGLPPDDLFWRVHFMIGVMCHTLTDTQRLPVLSQGRCDPTDVDEVLDQLVPFLAAGLQARARVRRTGAGAPKDP